MSPLIVRKIHKYVGMFFAPAILFFCLTGLLQTFDLHKVRPGQTPPDLVLRLAALHKDQTVAIHRRAPARPADGGKPRRETQTEAEPALAQTLLKLFVAATSISLAATTLMGIFLALQAPRGRAATGLVLALGMVAPAVLILLL